MTETYAAYDHRGKRIEVGDTIAYTFRDGKFVDLRHGTVLSIDYGPTPNIEAPEDETFSILVQWKSSSLKKLPKRPTKVEARKALLCSVPA